MATRRSVKKETAKRVSEKRTTYRAPKNNARSKETRTEHPHITTKAGRMGGAPCIKGTRIAVWIVAQAYDAGRTIGEMLDDWPHTNEAQLYDALSYYHDHKEEVDALIAANSIEATRAWLNAQAPAELIRTVHLDPERRASIRERVATRH